MTTVTTKTIAQETFAQGEICVESRNPRILPTLDDWREREAGNLALHTPRHAGAERADAIPREYALMDADELDRRIGAARAKLGDRLVILGHHYQRDEVIKYADARGDSFKLAQFAAARPEADADASVRRMARKWLARMALANGCTPT